MTQASEWTRVEDSLPKDYQDVIAYAPDFDPQVFAVRFLTWSDGDETKAAFDWAEGAFDTPAVGGKITHWMSMPEPPKDGAKPEG